MRATLILSLCWGTLIVLAAVIGKAGATIANSKSRIAKPWRAATIGKILFWLTCHVDCAWCKRRVHRAIWPRPYHLAGGIVAPAISHTICPKCLAKVVTELSPSGQPVEIEEREMHATRRSILGKILQHAK